MGVFFMAGANRCAKGGANSCANRGAVLCPLYGRTKRGAAGVLAAGGPEYCAR